MSKREDYISWDDFFMGVAILAAQRSKDPHTQVGACLVNKEKKIVGVGYNGFPNGCSDDVFPWDKTSNSLESKYLFVVHSEINTITGCIDKAELKGSIMYVTLFPCNECAKVIIQSGIRHICYLSDKYKESDSVVAAKRMFDASGVCYKQFVPDRKKIEIDFKCD